MHNVDICESTWYECTSKDEVENDKEDIVVEKEKLIINKEIIIRKKFK